MPERLGAAAAAATARLPWTLLRPVAAAAAAALPFPSGRSADADGQLTTHVGPEPSS
ncbi:MAG TPA: hypothetical protein VH520_11130 [Streptosporangiaceae bacterium]